MIIRGGTVSTPTGGPAVVDDTKICKSPWSSQHTVDKLCPAFEETGTSVLCEPLEGYPLQVVSKLAPRESGYSYLTMRHGGKNLYDEAEYPLRRGYYVKQSVYKTDMCSCVEKFIPVAHLRGQKITISHVAPLNQPGLYFYTAADGNAVIQPSTQAGWKGPTFTVPDDASYMRFAVPIECADTRCVQIELGEVATDYEPFVSQKEYEVGLPRTVYGGSYNWNTGELIMTHNGVWEDEEFTSNFVEFVEYNPPLVYQLDPHEIVGYAGGNTLTTHRGAGELQVSGKADPVAIIDKLTNAILSLGGNI